MRGAGSVGGGILAGQCVAFLPFRIAAAQTPAPAIVTAESERPNLPFGVMSGDPTGGRAIIWSKTDRPARMLVEVATRENFSDARKLTGPAALAPSDYTARIDLGRLPAGADILRRRGDQGRGQD